MAKSDAAPAAKAVLAHLNQRATELEAEIAAKQQRQPANDPHDVTDQQEEASTSVRAEVRSAEIERDLAELRAIGQARERIEAGSYGECIDCGVQIDAKRLAAQPTALRCIPCQEKFEQAERRAS